MRVYGSEEKRREMLVRNVVIARFLLLVCTETVKMSRSPREQVVSGGMLSESPYQGLFTV